MNGGPKATVGPKPPQIDFVKPADSTKDFSVGSSEPSATELEFGLWDHLITPGGSVQAGVDEDKNFVGADSRRFYIRVRDDSAKGRGFVEADWWTAFTSSPARTPGTVQDDPKSVLTLFEVAGSPGVFTSRGLTLVCDDGDRRIKTNSGISSSDPKLGSQAGLRDDTQSNYRIRRCGMFSFVVASYSPKTSKAKSVTAIVSVFSKSTRRLLPVQVYVVRESKGGAASIAPADLFANDLPATRETYERIGIWLWTAVSAADDANSAVEKVTAPPPSLSYKLCVVDPPPGVNPAKLDKAMVGALGRAFPAIDPNTLRLFFVKDFNFTDLSFKPLGRSFGITPDPAPAAGCTATVDPPDTAGICVVRLDRGDNYTAAHELGHLLTDKSKVRKGKLHPTDLLDTCIDEDHYREASAVTLRVNMNLMNGNGPWKPPQAFADPKRIWNNFDDDMVNQLVKIPSSRFLR
ncbi:MAG TPA: hypothetical protein VFA33_18480 [Bryobacteraceae bacterium]|nr:hypothetical protein [Bryobacteraceae bacterium]